MPGLIWGLLAAGLIAFLMPSYIPQRIRSALPDSLIRAVGAVVVVISLLSTSFVYVPDGHLGQLFRVYGGGSMTSGRIVAVSGENGPQARILTPGFHAWPLVNLLYNVDTNQPEVNIPSGKVGILTAKDGAALGAGQFMTPQPLSHLQFFLDGLTITGPLCIRFKRFKSSIFSMTGYAFS